MASQMGHRAEGAPGSATADARVETATGSDDDNDDDGDDDAADDDV